MKPISILFVVLLLASGIAQAVDEELLADEEPMQLGHQAYVSGDFKQAAKIWTPLAERGLAQAQFYLSNLYAQGEGVEDDPVAALSWLSRSANGHYPAAQFNLGNRYYQGLWVKRDYAKALEWWGKAAEQGVPKAAFNMAALHYLGLGTKKNVAEAMHWYRRAAEAGSLEAKVVLAKLEEGGQPPVAEPQLAKVPAKPAKPSNQPVVVGTPEESAAWIKAQAPDHYTVQLYAANTVSAVERFIQGLDAGDRLAVFGFPRDGKPYFAVIQGSYPSSEAAKAKAMEMTGQSTWVRNFAGIRAIMAE